MPVENPIDKLYSSATGMPFPVSAAAGQSSEPDPGPKPEPEPEPSDAVAEVTYDDSDPSIPFRISAQVPVPEQISSVEDIVSCEITIGFHDQWDTSGNIEFGSMGFDCYTEENSLQIVDDLLEIRGFENHSAEDAIHLFCENYNSEDAPYPYAQVYILANEDPETGEGDEITIPISWTFTGETPCNVGE